ncbi:MAG: Glu-tRNA(Gln) amidotransferase subunit GatD [Candidatus Micrarchaeota archaeon]|nr:Glu-tRNA(Gln) amidotransferase subunit GatD [Candidatus Micrarchaeota archaeon]
MPYSEKILRALGKENIEVGDKLELVSGDFKLVGELMPKTEVGDPDTFVIKIDNGYNVGIRHAAASKVKLISKGTGAPKFESATMKSKPGLPKVAMIYTGGTIGSKIDYKTGGVYMLIKPGELLNEVPELAEMANLEIRHLFSIASEDISYMEWQTMAKEVESAFADGARGVVITMGTDAMHYTAAVLSFMLKNLSGPVVITGAQRSSDRGSSDAFFNLACAVKIAAESDIAEIGVCMHASSSDDRCAFTRGTKVRKMHTSRRDAFRPVNDRPIAYVDNKLQIRYNNDHSKIGPRKGKTEAVTGFEPKVALIKSHPNFDPSILDAYVEKGFRGIIIEGTGLGHVPASTTHKEYLWLDHIKKAIQEGVVVGMTSQCLYGRVHPDVYRNLRLVSNLGVVYCEDMTPETAYAKLGWLLGNYKPEEAKELLSKNIAGEIKERTEADEFLN